MLRGFCYVDEIDTRPAVSEAGRDRGDQVGTQHRARVTTLVERDDVGFIAKRRGCGDWTANQRRRTDLADLHTWGALFAIVVVDADRRARTARKTVVAHRLVEDDIERLLDDRCVQLRVDIITLGREGHYPFGVQADAATGPVLVINGVGH